MDQFEVQPFTITTLEQIVAEKSESSPELIGRKLHREYFKGYFEFIGARTIVVENGYIDRDYLDDFAGYYVRCFEPYRRYCTRLHFFNLSFDQEDFENFLSRDTSKFDADTLRRDYLGFVVIKPLPQTVVGRTCLRTYPPEGRRHFPITRTYRANLYGLELCVESLAFQEQDRAVAACATSALWSVFQGTGILFQHPILSPVAITKAACERFPLDTRTLPSKGLTTNMMAHAIRSVGLEPDSINVSTEEYVLQGTLYAYLRGGIPIILGIELFDTSRKVSIGLHAVAITGFSLGGNTKPHGGTDFLLKASRIDKLYVHDDQVGPFARMELDGKTVAREIQDKEAGGYSITTSWRGGDGQIGSVRAIPGVLQVPLYNKIRIPYDVIHDAVVRFDSFVETLKEGISLSYPERLEWDIYLTTVNDFKSEIAGSTHIPLDIHKDILVSAMPRFIWRATAFSADTPILDLLFDATDIPQGEFFVRAIEYDKELSLVLRAVAHDEALKIHEGLPEWKIIQWFTRS